MHMAPSSPGYSLRVPIKAANFVYHEDTLAGCVPLTLHLVYEL